MRAWTVTVAATAALLAACTGGDGAGGGTSVPPSSAVSTLPAAPSPSAPEPASTTPSVAVPAADPPGSLTLRIDGFTLPAEAAIRVVVRASSPHLTVRRTGAGGALSVCPVADVSGSADPSGCVDLGAGRDVDLGGGRGVEIEARGGVATVEDVALTYLPVDRSMTIVTPARPASTCSATPCEATFAVTPARPGPFSLAAQPGGGRPRLTLRSEVAGAPPRVLATVAGGGALSITATLEPAAEAVLLYREQMEGPVAALPMEISWP